MECYTMRYDLLIKNEMYKTKSKHYRVKKSVPPTLQAAGQGRQVILCHPSPSRLHCP